jgi:hypothetical protein
MRFISNGPSIPDPLLIARDEGRVVFFCGAGVSRARARLPDFFGLAEDVVHRLGVATDSPVRKILRKVREVEDDFEVAGFFSADRVFALLEREFTVEDIRGAVAKALTPNADPDVSAHRLLLRLARTPDSKMQLVTTNFDRLFEKCGVDLETHQPPRLPNPSRYNDFNGLVYLHGRVNQENTGTDGEGFVLSSSDFGHAYLSEGWATEFVREIVRTYVIVFVGYSADDPPIHYLLEGMRRTPDPFRRLYAFQANQSNDTLNQWRHKGVEAISYAPTDDHAALWETLELWAKRADDPIVWRRTVLEAAMKGPQGLESHQRGQVAHIVSTDEGARAFAECTPPAEWLCVFDPSCRYARPGWSERFDFESPIVDPFTLYGLDADVKPQVDGGKTTYSRREVPSNAWDGLLSNSFDLANLSGERFPLSRVQGETSTHWLPKRLERIGMWIANVANQPHAVWWAARQKSLHSAIRRTIEWQLDFRQTEVKPAIRQAWAYLIESWDRADGSIGHDWHHLKVEIERKGWSLWLVRRFGSFTRPYVTAESALMSPPVPPKADPDISLPSLVELKVEFPAIPSTNDIPDEWLESVLRLIRQNIELAVRLCEEVDDMERFHISPLVPDGSPDATPHMRTHGLSGWVLLFASLFERLIAIDRSKARRECAAWPVDDETAFSRLRVWAGGKPESPLPTRSGESSSTCRKVRSGTRTTNGICCLRWRNAGERCRIGREYKSKLEC